MVLEQLTIALKATLHHFHVAASAGAFHRGANRSRGSRRLSLADHSNPQLEPEPALRGGTGIQLRESARINVFWDEPGPLGLGLIEDVLEPLAPAHRAIRRRAASAAIGRLGRSRTAWRRGATLRMLTARSRPIAARTDASEMAGPTALRCDKLIMKARQVIRLSN